MDGEGLGSDPSNIFTNKTMTHELNEGRHNRKEIRLERIPSTKTFKKTAQNYKSRRGIIWREKNSKNIDHNVNHYDNLHSVCPLDPVFLIFFLNIGP